MRIFRARDDASRGPYPRSEIARRFDGCSRYDINGRLSGAISSAPRLL